MLSSPGLLRERKQNLAFLNTKLLCRKIILALCLKFKIINFLYVYITLLNKKKSGTGGVNLLFYFLFLKCMKDEPARMNILMPVRMGVFQVDVTVFMYVWCCHLKLEIPINVAVLCVHHCQLIDIRLNSIVHMSLKLCKFHIQKFYFVNFSLISFFC